jgi:hypothetical protein
MVNENSMSPSSITKLGDELQQRVMRGYKELQQKYQISDIDLELFRSLTYKLVKPKEQCTTTSKFLSSNRCHKCIGLSTFFPEYSTCSLGPCGQRKIG